jgi:hypothetical protein
MPNYVKMSIKHDIKTRCVFGIALSGTLKIERFESQIILKLFGNNKAKGIYGIAKIPYGHLYQREKNLSFNNNCIS